MTMALPLIITSTRLTEQSHFKHLNENSTYLTPDDWPKVDALLDYLNDKRINERYKMVNPIQHMQDMKQLMRGEVPPWQCRAGHNSLIIRTDGSLAPVSRCIQRHMIGALSATTSSRSSSWTK